MTASRAIAMLIIALLGYFLILEVAMRTVVTRLSKGQQREIEDRREAVLLKPRTPDGSTSILVVGNSLLLHGIDRARLQQEMGSRYHVVLYPIEGTTYLDWYFGLRRLFAEGARPTMLVLCISVRQLVYYQTAGEGFAHTMMSIADLPAVVRAGHLDMMTASAYFFANPSAWLGGRSSLRNGLLEDPKPHFVDQAGLFEQFDECARRYEAAPRVPPAQQGLGARDDAAPQVDARLVVQLQLVARHRMSQVAEQRGALGDARVERRLEPGNAGATACLGAVHRHVGAPHQIERIRAVLRMVGQSDAGPDHCTVRTERNRLRQLRQSILLRRSGPCHLSRQSDRSDP